MTGQRSMSVNFSADGSELTIVVPRDAQRSVDGGLKSAGYQPRVLLLESEALSEVTTFVLSLLADPTAVANFLHSLFSSLVEKGSVRTFKLKTPAGVKIDATGYSADEIAEVLKAAAKIKKS